MGDIDISFDASRAVRAALDRFGRTEDVRLSPDNRRLALPCFDCNSIAIVDVEITMGGGRPTVTLSGMTEFSAPGLNYPHGVDFLDDETIIVANRNASVRVFRLPPTVGTVGATDLIPIDPPPARGFELMHGPSSIALTRRSDGDTEVLIGHRFADALTRHVLHTDGAGSLTVTTNDVLVYERSSALDESSEPVCILRGASYPHGVRFSPDGRHLFVADAGSPHVYLHARDGEAWSGVQYPAGSLRVIDDELFARGRYNCREGGPKGVDIDRSGRVLTVTCECQPLAFFDVSALLERSSGDAGERPPPDRSPRLGGNHVSDGTGAGEDAACVHRRVQA